MKPIEIHLSEPFKEVLAGLLTLPSTHAEIDEIDFPDAADSTLRKSAKCDAEVIAAFRSLYEAANGRQVETQVGFIAIAPPVASFLKDEPYCVATQHEFFLEALARILAAGSPPRRNRTNGAETRDGKLVAGRRVGINVPHSYPRRGNGRGLLRSTATRFASKQH
jgi:hypothetical protein